MGFEAAIARWDGANAPTLEALRALHAARLRGRAVPLCVIAYNVKALAWIFGPSVDATPLGPLSAEQAARIVQAALDEPSGSAARARLLRTRDALETAEVPGLDPQGLFATHELTWGVPRRADWSTACERARALLAIRPRGSELIAGLGFQSRQIPGNAHLLSAAGQPPRAVAILLRDDEAFDAESPRFAKSPIYHGLEVAAQNRVPWLVVMRGPQLRLYPTSPDVGVGRRGVTQTYFGLDLALLDDEHIGFLDLVFSAAALAPDGTVDDLLAKSRDYAVSLGERLRDRVYTKVVDPLSTAVARAIGREAPLDEARLAAAYRLTLRILFRLLFQAYAEDTRLLPLRRNERYTAASLKELAQDLAHHPDRPHDERSTSLWDGLIRVWRVIDTGDEAWGVPPYNGGLFGSDAELHPDGAAIERLALTNDVVGPALAGLLVDVTPGGWLGPVDFRSLDVRDFGTIYEGLLESGVSIADEDLREDASGAWRPAGTRERVDAAAGTPYFHTKSGERKATGSYFTKPFAVEHLLERALDPAIDAHLARVSAMLAKGDQAGAAREFFDFRVADIAMGSGHFLVAAIGHIEAKFGAFLEREQIPGVERELLELSDAAESAMARVGIEAEIDRSALLSRQIAKRCVYGVDLNEIAVELARLAIWVRTFVPGLPMSSLNHQLACGNSLTGIGTVEEALDALDPDARAGNLTFSGTAIRSALDRARSVLEDAAALKEVNRAESVAAQEAARRAMEAAEPARLLFDAAVAVRLGLIARPSGFDSGAIGESAATPVIREAVDGLRPGHFPVMFPEVFLRPGAGFDVVLGNPPWEKVKVEEHLWWAHRFPGLRSLPAKRREARIADLKEERIDLLREYEQEVRAADLLRDVLQKGPFPGIGSGDIDLFKAFCWRNWQLLRSGGRLGVLLPRTALSGSGTILWRRTVLAEGAFSDVAFITNSARWAFEQIHPQYTFALTVATKGSPGTVRFGGPFYSLAEYQARRDEATEVTSSEFLEWTGTAAFPLLPTARDAEIFRQMRQHPPFRSSDGFDFRPVAELHATADRKHFSVDVDEPIGTIPVLAGASFNLWDPDAGRPYAFAARDDLEQHLLTKARSQASRKGSAFYGLSLDTPSDLPLSRARIALRDVARPTDSRTAIPVLLPPLVSVVHNAPYLLRRSGDESDEAYLLGVMSSIPFDWYVRRVVELHFTFEVLAPIPIPRPSRDHPDRVRVATLAARIAAKDQRFAAWADAVGVGIATVVPHEMPQLLAELDAAVGILYGLTSADIEHIFTTFHRGWNYEDRLSRVLAAYRRPGARA